MKLSKLTTKYIGGLTHTHTVLSNHPSHREADLTVDQIVATLSQAGLSGHPDSPLQFVLLNEHPSDPGQPRRLGRFSSRGRRLLHQSRRQVVKGVHLLYGLEVSLLPGGQTDLTPRLADHCDLVIASRHRLPDHSEHDPQAIMQLFKEACDNPSVDVLGHPARYIENEPEVDWSQVFAWAADSGTAIEVNLASFPGSDSTQEQRQFWTSWLKQLSASPAAVFIGTDLHNQLQLDTFITQWHNLDHPKGRDQNHLALLIEALDQAKISPDRVISASLKRLRAWQAVDKADRAQVS